MDLIILPEYQMFGKLLDTASLLKAKLAKDELDQALIEATNDDNWQASTTILHEISSSAYNHEKWRKINDFLWDKLRNTKRWKKILKALNIVEFLLKNGPEFAVDQLKRDRDFFSTMESFQALEDGMDRGASIRQRARIVVSLMDKEDLLEDERVRAKQIRERMSHLAGSSSFNNENPQRPNSSISNKYESFSSSSYKSNEDNNGFYNYGSGNYGDREENKHHRDDYFQHVARKTEEPKRDEPKETKKEVESPVRSKIQPIVTLNLRGKGAEKKNGQSKANYETLAQKLMKGKGNTSTVPIVPDLSYKKKNAQDLLIDTEAYFVQHKYHFEEQAHNQQNTSYNETVSPVKDREYEPPVIQQNQAIIPPVLPNLTEFDSLLFLGIQPSQPVKSQPKIESPYKNIPQPAPISPPPQIKNPLTLPTPNPAPIMTPPPVQQNPITSLPPYNYNPYAYSQPYYSNPSAIQYIPNVPNTNIYSAPAYNPTYYQPPVQNYYYNQSTPAVTTPYSSYNPPIYQANPSPSSPPPAPVNQRPSKNEDEFGEFKNGGSFDISKINWMSKKQKNLTDLTDFTLEVKDIPKSKVQPQKEFSNNLKIDPWAW